MTPTALLSLLILAQVGDNDPVRGYTISWAVIVLGLIVGIVPALRPANREAEVKKPKSSSKN